MHLTTLLLAAALAAAASVAEATTSTLFGRLHKFQQVVVECSADNGVVEEVSKLDLCGFTPVINPVHQPTRDRLDALEHFILSSLPIDTSSSSSASGSRIDHENTVLLQTVHSPTLAQAINAPTYLPPYDHDHDYNSSTLRVTATLLAGSSHYRGTWYLHDQLFPQHILRKTGLGFYDVGLATRHDLVIPLFTSAASTSASGEDSPLEVCVGSHYVSGVTEEECRLLVDGTKRALCLQVAAGECPEWAVHRQQGMMRGEGLLIDSRTLRRYRGADYDPRRIRVSIHATFYVAPWWFSKEEAAVDCTMTTGGGGLWFGNANVGGGGGGGGERVVELYRGNVEFLGALPPGGNLTVNPAAPGIYTLRVDGKARVAWEVTAKHLQASSSSSSTVFYAQE